MQGDLCERLGPFEGEAVVTHHAAWGRLVERYGLHEAAVIQVSEQVEQPTTAAAWWKPDITKKKS